MNHVNGSLINFNVYTSNLINHDDETRFSLTI